MHINLQLSQLSGANAIFKLYQNNPNSFNYETIIKSRIAKKKYIENMSTEEVCSEIAIFIKNLNN